MEGKGLLCSRHHVSAEQLRLPGASCFREERRNKELILVMIMAMDSAASLIGVVSAQKNHRILEWI